MTKEEADRRVALAEKALVTVVRERYFVLDAAGTPIGAALKDLRDAERDRAALDMPRLREPADIITEAFSHYWNPSNPRAAGAAIIGLVRLDILAQAEKLPRLSRDSYPIVDDGDAINIHDLRALFLNGEPS